MINKFFYCFLCFFISSCTSHKHKLQIKRSDTFFNNLQQDPENLHPIRSTDYYSAVIRYYVLESLLQVNKDTNKLEASLAKSWSIHPNKMSFTFVLRDNLKWSDGSNLTAKDVKFSFDAYVDPAYGGIHYISYYENISSAHVINNKTIKFIMKRAYFANFKTIAIMKILPEHIYKDPKAKHLSRTIHGSGPYKLTNYVKGKILVLKKNPLWVGASFPENKGKWKMPKIAFRFVKTERDIILRMEKEHLDFSFLSPESFREDTKTPIWKTKLQKVKITNLKASGYRFVGFNLKKPLFQNKQVRRALAHLFNRKLMNDKFHFGKKELSKGPWYFWSKYADPTVPAIKFNPKKAVALLKKSGWEDRDKNGILEKYINGKKKEFIFTITFSSPHTERYLTMYQQDLKQVGIRLKLKILDWTSFLQFIDDKSFDAISLGWGSGNIDIDPKQLWHSDSARAKGSNFISYSNPKVDKLIDLGRKQFDKKKRIQLFKKVYRLIAEDTPYIFLFHARKKFYGVHKRIKRSADTFNYSVGLDYWALQKVAF